MRDSRSNPGPAFPVPKSALHPIRTGRAVVPLTIHVVQLTVTLAGLPYYLSPVQQSVCGPYELTENRDRAVTKKIGGEQKTVENDDVNLRIGGDPPPRYLERIGVQVVDEDIPLAAEQATGGA